MWENGKHTSITYLCNGNNVSIDVWGYMMINLNVEALTHNDVRGYIMKDYIDLIC